MSLKSKKDDADLITFTFPKGRFLEQKCSNLLISENNTFKVAGGIGFRKPHAGEPPTVFINSHFGFEDSVEGNFVKGMERWVFGGIG